MSSPPSWSSSSFEKKNKKYIPKAARLKDIDNVDSSSIKNKFLIF